jgi:hypothetical protein
MNRDVVFLIPPNGDPTYHLAALQGVMQSYSNAFDANPEVLPERTGLSGTKCVVFYPVTDSKLQTFRNVDSFDPRFRSEWMASSERQWATSARNKCFPLKTNLLGILRDVQSVFNDMWGNHYDWKRNNCQTLIIVPILGLEFIHKDSVSAFVRGWNSIFLRNAPRKFNNSTDFLAIPIADKTGTIQRPDNPEHYYIRLI